MQSDIEAVPHAPRLTPIGVFERYLLSPESYERLRASGFKFISTVSVRDGEAFSLSHTCLTLWKRVGRWERAMMQVRVRGLPKGHVALRGLGLG